jgi:hypothetical protein
MRGLADEFPNEGFALNFKYRTIPSLIGRYSHDSAAEGVEMEGKVPANGSQGCTSARCYGREMIGWNQRVAACAKGVRVGVIDTGFDESHPTFKMRDEGRLDVVMRPKAGRARDWHGTGVLSLLAGAARSSTPGLIPEAHFLIADAFFPNWAGKPETDTLHLLEALDRLNQNGAQIINMSLVGPRDDLLHQRIKYLSKFKGVIFVAAAGNDGSGSAPAYPAAYREVIAVTALDRDRKGYRDANRGSYITVAAPGVHIWAALPDVKEGMLTGTSFAAPFVTAIVAMGYNKSPLRSEISANRLPLAPKEMTVAGLFIDPLADGDDARQRETFGRGLIKAPKDDCAPKVVPQAWAAKVLPAPSPPAAWEAYVKRTSFQ